MFALFRLIIQAVYFLQISPPTQGIYFCLFLSHPKAC